MLTEGFRYLETLGFIGHIRSSTLAYAAVNGLHILGLSILVGAVLTFDLRASGLWKRDLWREGLDVAIPVAGVGLLLAIASGLLLFAVRGTYYSSLTVFLVKIGILAVGFTNILVCHRLIRKCVSQHPPIGIRICAITSATAWISALFAGRWIAFA